MHLPNTPYYLRMAIGHQARKGHALVATLEPNANRIYALVRTCCKEN